MKKLQTIILALAATFIATPCLQAMYLDNESDLIYYGHRYYNPSTGRWLSRDPIGERGGKNLYAFVRNDSKNRWDKLGQQCCLTTIAPGTFDGPNGPDKSTFGHSILKCDSGAYVSLWPADDPNYHSWDEDQDNKVYASAKKTTTCFPCLDETKVQQWIDANKALTWSLSYNCADATLAAIAAGLPDPQTKPHCPCTWERGVKWVVEDLTQPSGAFQLPSTTEDQLTQLVNNGCSRYKCVLKGTTTGKPIYAP